PSPRDVKEAGMHRRHVTLPMLGCSHGERTSEGTARGHGAACSHGWLAAPLWCSRGRGRHSEDVVARCIHWPHMMSAGHPFTARMRQPLVVRHLRITTSRAGCERHCSLAARWLLAGRQATARPSMPLLARARWPRAWCPGVALAASLCTELDSWRRGLGRHHCLRKPPWLLMACWPHMASGQLHTAGRAWLAGGSPSPRNGYMVGHASLSLHVFKSPVATRSHAWACIRGRSPVVTP
ncbi:hypothetical protein Dimus_030589, partial [Dionaea muscipula]